jgi:hypothetical protein
MISCGNSESVLETLLMSYTVRRWAIRELDDPGKSRPTTRKAYPVPNYGPEQDRQDFNHKLYSLIWGDKLAGGPFSHRQNTSLTLGLGLVRLVFLSTSPRMW